MNIESVPIEGLTADPCNARTHDARNIEAIAASLKHFGQQKPIVVGTDGVVIAGSGTLDAARSLDWTHIDIVRSELGDDDRKAYGLADNRTAELAGWDEQLVLEQIDELKLADIDIGSIGFADDVLEQWRTKFQPTDGTEQGQLDQFSLATCPECGHEFKA